MTPSKHVRTRVRILVKAFPQHSDKYQETVCCAGVTDDAQLIRLYPITYRRLAQENQFNRYDLIEATLTKASPVPIVTSIAMQIRVLPTLLVWIMSWLEAVAISPPSFAVQSAMSRMVFWYFS